MGDSAADYCSEYMAASGIKEFYECKYDPKSEEFWKKIELPGGADDSYVCIGVKASNYFMPKETLSEKGPGGGGWIIINKNLQVETRAGAVWGDGVVFAVGDCNYGCIGSPDDWKLGKGMNPVPKISYPGEEQAIHACWNINILEKQRRGACCAPKNLKPTWWPWGAGMFATSLGPHDACFVLAANHEKGSGYMVTGGSQLPCRRRSSSRRRSTSARMNGSESSSGTSCITRLCTSLERVVSSLEDT